MQSMKPIETLQAKYSKAPTTPYDPSPTRMEYKVQRLWLTPFIRTLVGKGIPAFVLAILAMAFFADQENYATLNAAVVTAKQNVETRPEYSVSKLEISGASVALQQEIQNGLGVEFPTNTFALDLDALRTNLENVPGVQSAVLRVVPGGILSVDVQEIYPKVIWRQDGELHLLSETGGILRAANARGDHPTLPLIAGAGGRDAVAEALDIFAESTPIHPTLRGLVRVGERRWDLILTGDQRISLPEHNPLGALREVLILANSRDLLRRDVTVVDFRNAYRPTVRLSSGAVEVMRQLKPAVENRTN